MARRAIPTTATSSVAPTRPDGWLSYHLYLNEEVDTFLVRRLCPFLERETATGSVGRFFFLRYSEGGHHLRLRFLPPRAGRSVATLAQSLHRSLADLLAAHGAEVGVTANETTIRREPYRRSEHSFGATVDSIYSELLHEATSWLALRMLASLGPDDFKRRWLILTATLDFLCHSATTSEGRYRNLLEASRRFAATTGRRLQHPMESRSATGRARWAAAVREVARPVAEALRDDPLCRRSTALLRRVRRRPRGEFVGIHALHLLCNKVGFTLDMEHEAYAALSHLAHHPAGAGSARIPTVPRPGPQEMIHD